MKHSNAATFGRLTALPALATIAVALAFALSASPAWADSGNLTSGSIADGALGVQADDDSEYAPVESNANIYSRVKTVEYSGATMYETAISQAMAAYPSGTASAIIVGPGDAWIDALSASSLAASKGPILYSGKDAMNDASLQALEDMGVASVIIIGGTEAVGEGVQDDLEDAGIVVEERLWGERYYDTQLAIFEYGLENDLWGKDFIVLATGSAFGDALSASPVAYAYKAPIFVAAGDNELTDDQMDAWEAAAAEGYGAQAVVVGGPAAVGEDSRDFAGKMSALAGGSGEIEWRWGATQYETSESIAQWATEERGFSWNNVAYTTGLAPWDALAGSVLQGQERAVLMLADSMYNTTISVAESHKSAITSLRLFGGKRATTPNVRMALADALGFPAASLPNFKLYLDAGHGWNDNGNDIYDSGAVGNGYEEHDLCVELVNKIAPHLRAKGVDLFVNDDGGPYALRHAEAYSLGCDEIVSIHFNAGGGSGTLSLIHEYNANEYSETLQEKLHPYLVEGMGGLYDYGMRTQEVAILGGPLPAVLLEICFIDDEDDIATYQERKDYVAFQLANGIMN